MMFHDDHPDVEKTPGEQEAEDQGSESNSECEKSVDLNKDESFPEWRKGKLTRYQHVLRKIEKVYSEEVKSVVRHSEKSMFATFEALSKEVEGLTIKVDQKDDTSGEVILKAVYMLHEISENYIISLKSHSFSVVIAKLFEYLANFDKN